MMSDKIITALVIKSLFTSKHW